MSALSGKGLRDRWIANAESLDKQGHFASYSPKQREEVLKKGFLGRYPPDQAIRMAREQAERGHGLRTAKFNDEVRAHFRLVGAEVRDKLLQVLDEIPPESYQPPSEISEPPGCPFIFRCSVLGCEIYFKFQIEGTARKPRVLFWSCHPPRYEIKREES
jgi:hypothetical protein